MSMAMAFRFGLAILHLHPAQVAPIPPPTPNVAEASWYDDGGQTASGRHYRYGFASLLFGSDWGLPIRFRHGSNTATGQLDDHGPYVSGRQFDLNPSLKAALGCGDLCQIEWGYAR
jgi:hypothetical protein